MTAQGGLAGWAERSALRRAGSLTTAGSVPGRLRFVFYGRVSTEDWQDPVTSRARQREQAEALVRGHGQIVAELFDVGQSCTVAWARRPQSAALVAQLADSDRGWDAVVIGEYERAFYGSQYAAMAPLFEHYGVQLRMPETGGRVDYQSEHDENTMTVLGLSSKREITRTSIRVRTAMAAQTREQGRYLGGRPPYGYRLADAGPHPNKAHAAWGRRAHKLDPDPVTAPTVRWIFTQRLAGHSVARVARALNEAGVPCPSAADPARNTHRSGAGWTLGTVTTILENPRYTGRQVSRAADDGQLLRGRARADQHHGRDARHRRVDAGRRIQVARGDFRSGLCQRRRLVRGAHQHPDGHLSLPEQEHRFGAHLPGRRHQNHGVLLSPLVNGLRSPLWPAQTGLSNPERW